MEDPGQEIVKAVKLFTTAASPDIQKAAIERFFAPNAGLNHPFCTVLPGPSSRDKIVSVYQWYRIMSPHISLEVESFTYDVEQQVIYLNVVQIFHIPLSIFKPAPARLLVRVKVRENLTDHRFYIVQQDDHYQPEDILYLIVPPLATPLNILKRLSAPLCWLGTTAFHTLGVWRPDPAGLPHQWLESSPVQDGHGVKGKHSAQGVNGIAGKDD